MCLTGGMPRRTAFSLSLSRETAYAMLECQTKVRENVVSKYHFPLDNYQMQGQKIRTKIYDS